MFLFVVDASAEVVIMCCMHGFCFVFDFVGRSVSRSVGRSSGRDRSVWAAQPSHFYLRPSMLAIERSVMSSPCLAVRQTMANFCGSFSVQIWEGCALPAPNPYAFLNLSMLVIIKSIMSSPWGLRPTHPPPPSAFFRPSCLQ